MTPAGMVRRVPESGQDLFRHLTRQGASHTHGALLGCDFLDKFSQIEYQLRSICYNGGRMWKLSHHGPGLCDGLSRREWMRIGGVSLGGVTLPQLLARSARTSTEDRHILQPGFGKAKSVILIALLGGPSQQDTFDCKPNAPVEIRGQLGTIPTSVRGIRVGELMPMTACHMDKLAALRAVVTDDNAHSSSGYYMLTGVPHLIPVEGEFE